MRKLLPRRDDPETVRPLAPAAVKRALVRMQKFKGHTHAHILHAGTAKSPLSALQEEALAVLDGATESGLREASIDVLAAAKHFLQRVDHEVPFFGVLCTLRGVADGLRVLRRSLDLGLDAASGGWMTAVWLSDHGRATNLHLGVAEWTELRHAICAAPEYEELVLLARELRADAPLGHRAPLAFLFPDQTWGNEDLGEKGNTDYLLAVATDPAVVRAYAKPHAFATWALELVHHLPAKDFLALAAEALPELLKKPKYGPLLKTPPREIVEAVACLRSEEAAALLRAYASNAILAPIVNGYFRDAGPAPKSRAREKVGKTPELLKGRPWRTGKSAKPNVVSVEMRGLEHERIELPTSIPRFGTEARPMTEEEHTKWRADAEHARYVQCDYAWSYKQNRVEYLEVPFSEQLWAWNRGASLSGSPFAFIERHGLAAMPGFLSRDWIRWLGQSEYDGADFFATMCFLSPRVAPKIARVAARRKAYRKPALEWLEAHLPETVNGLLPDALGPASEARTDAEAALLFLARRGRAEEIKRLAKTDALDALLARDPLALGVTPPKRPDFLRVRELSPVPLKSGGTLDADGLDALLELFQVMPIDEPYAGLAPLPEVCDLEVFAVELLEQWVLADAPGRHEWMLHAVVHVPSKESERRLTTLAREWARKSQEKAKRACDALAALGVLGPLAHIADTTRYDALRNHAAARLAEAATARGLTAEELEDHIVPEVSLELAPGTFADLDELLEPIAPSAKLSKEARERLRELKKDLARVADRQRRRLERAMVSGRTWKELRAQIADHPLLKHFARRLLWIAGKTAFRVAEDGSFATVTDDTFELPANARVRLAHPARDRLEGWARVFADYRILQPFEQLGREVFTSARGLAGIEVAAKKTLGVLESRGFRRDSAGEVSAFERPAGAFTVRVPLEPGFSIEMLAHAPLQKVGMPTAHDASGAAVALEALDAVSFSELVRDVSALRG